MPSLLLGEKTVLGGVKFFPDALKLLQEQPHVLCVLHNQNILTVILDGLCGPIEGASDEHLLVNDGKLMVHVAKVLVMPYLYTCGAKAALIMPTEVQLPPSLLMSSASYYRVVLR